MLPVLLHPWSTLEVGAAYKAKILCTGLFGCGLPLDPARSPEVSDGPYRPMRLFGARVDRERKQVTVSLAGLRPRTARWRPGWGATLLNGSERELPKAPTPLPPGDPRLPWPRGESAVEAEPPALARVLAAAFDEPDPRRLRRTRAALVARDGKLLAERYAPGITAATPLPGWSMTKSVFGVLAGAAVKTGVLSLDKRGLLSAWGEGDPRAEISLEDVLRMRTGLRFREDYSDPSADATQMLFARPDAAAYAASRPLEAEIGTVWNYSSGTSNILSRALWEALGDGAYHRFPRRALFEPLGMASAVVEPDASGTFVASSFMLATARDWARVGQLMLQDGVWKGVRLLPEGWAAFSASPTEPSKGRYGAHWWLKVGRDLGGDGPHASALPSDACHALGHEGQCLTVIPSERLVVVRLGVTVHRDGWDHAGFLASVLDALKGS